MPSFAMAMRAKPPEVDGDSDNPTFTYDGPLDNVMKTSSPEAQAATQTQTPRLIRSRRRRYLERHPSYYQVASGALELADPLAYDRLIRQHQSAAEREAEGKTRGFARTLEASLLRGEAKLSSIRPDAPDNESRLQPNGRNDQAEDSGSTSQPSKSERSKQDHRVDWSIAAVPESSNAAKLSPDQAKLQAEDKWRDLITERFVQGDDDEFDYGPVDADETLDADDGVAGTWSERKREEAWFDEETPDADTIGEVKAVLEGETGIQDF